MVAKIRPGGPDLAAITHVFIKATSFTFVIERG